MVQGSSILTEEFKDTSSCRHANLSILHVVSAIIVAHVSAQGGWVRQADSVCFSANRRTDAELFEAQSSGTIGGVRFLHLSGGVTNSNGQRPPTSFGHQDDGRLGTFLVSEVAVHVMYPSMMTEHVNYIWYSDNNMTWYRMDPRINDKVLTLRNPLYQVYRGELFRVEFVEVFNDYTLSDNAGTSCVAVDFLFMLGNEHEPTDSAGIEERADDEAMPLPAAEVLVQ